MRGMLVPNSCGIISMRFDPCEGKIVVIAICDFGALGYRSKALRISFIMISSTAMFNSLANDFRFNSTGPGGTNLNTALKPRRGREM